MQGTGAGPPTPAARTLTSARRALTTVPSSASTITVTSREMELQNIFQKYLQVATSVRTALARPHQGRPVYFLSNGQGKVLQYLELVRAAV